MNEKEFLVNLEELLEADAGTLNCTLELASLDQWDSLAFVSFIALADSKYGVKVAPSELRQCKIIGDLMKLVQKA